VGRTARAGRSGRSVTIVTQYDVEMFQKIEHLTGVKMEAFPAEREEVLLLLEQVGGGGVLMHRGRGRGDSGGAGGALGLGAAEGWRRLRVACACVAALAPSAPHKPVAYGQGAAERTTDATAKFERLQLHKNCHKALPAPP
jgi:hypothetical protein